MPPLISVLKSLKGKSLDSEGTDKVGDMLFTSDSPEIRQDVISVLVENKKRNPEKVNGLIKQAMSTEKSVKVLKRLIRVYHE